MNGPFASVDTTMITITQQRIEKSRQTGITSRCGDCSGGNSICFSSSQAMVSSLVARISRGTGQRGLARPRSGRYASRSRHSACRPKQGGLRLEFPVLEPRPVHERGEHDDDAEHGHDVRARSVFGPERPERADVVAPLVEGEAVDHGALLSSLTATPARCPFLTWARPSSRMGADSTSSPLGSTTVSGTRSNGEEVLLELGHVETLELDLRR